MAYFSPSCTQFCLHFESLTAQMAQAEAALPTLISRVLELQAYCHAWLSYDFMKQKDSTVNMLA